MRNILPFVLLLSIVLPANAQSDTALERVNRLTPMAMDEVLWLARGLYSESDRADEQELVGWVIRNRVETDFRGDSYREVILEPRQFSAFNTPSERRDYILGLDQEDVVPSWMSALNVALEVHGSGASERPFPIETRHFYSPVSMVGGARPNWASAGTELSSTDLGVDPDRFRFFSGIDQSREEALAAGDPATDPITASDKIDAKRIEQQERAAKRGSTVRGTVRVRRFSGKVSRPRRPRRGAGS
ncbi:MAG: hypothetical protein ACI9W4_001415 [Rhodothermales bacterium]|jgi:hypothetical protein